MTMPGMWWATCIRYIIWVDRAGIGHALAGTTTHRSHLKTVPVSTMMLGTPCENAETHACRLCSMSAHSAEYEADFKPWETASGHTRLQRYYPYADLGGWGGHAEVVETTVCVLGSRSASGTECRNLNRFGRAYATEFHHIKMPDIMDSMDFDVYLDDIGSPVAKQKRGVAIGGLCSAQAAQLYGMLRGRNAMSRLHSRGSPNKGGQNQNWLPHPCLLGGPKEGGYATSLLHSWGSPNKGGQNQNWLPHPCLLGGPKEGRNATSRGSANKRGLKKNWLPHPCLLGGPRECGNATSPLHSWGSPNKGGQN